MKLYHYVINEYSSLIVSKTSKNRIKIEYCVTPYKAVMSSIISDNMKFQNKAFLASKASEIVPKLRRKISLNIIGKCAEEKAVLGKNAI
jgi:hypothetical protein